MNLFSTPRLRVLVSVWWAFHCSKQALALDENAKSCSNSSALQCAGFFFLCSSQLREKCCLGTCLTWFQRSNLCALSKDLIQFFLLPSADCSLLRAGRGSKYTGNSSCLLQHVFPSYLLKSGANVLSLLGPSALEVQGTNIIQTDALVEKAPLVDSSLCSVSAFYRHMGCMFWCETGFKASETSDKIRSIFPSFFT